MDPITQLAMMYAINTGIGALQGKRGSNLFKGAFGDTAMQALTMQALGTGNFMPGGKPPAGMNFASRSQPPLSGMDAQDAMLFQAAGGKQNPVGKKNIFQRAGEGFEKTADFFKRDVTYRGADGSTMTRRETDPVKVGLASIGTAGALYGLGAFDPKKPDDPKYPGYNRFYAADPSMFMPYDDPDIDPIDYSKYPEGSPYSKMKKGGIASLEDGGPVKNIDLDPAEIFKKIMMEGYRPTQEEKDALDKYLADQEGKREGGIMSLQMGGRASNMPIESVEESTSEDMEMVPPPMGLPMMPPPPMQPSITPRQMFQPMMMAKDGALVDKLPSKTNTDENNTANYKRTSGKLVVDAAGKGNEEKDTMLAQLADGEFVTKSKAVRGAGIAMGANPNDKQEQRTLGARFFYKQMADFDKLAKRMSS